jgi:integrase
MTARRKGDKWMADFMVAGVRYREFGFSSDNEAMVWEYTARAALTAGRALPPGPAATAAPTKQSLEALTIQVYRRRWAAHKSGEHTLARANRFVTWAGPRLPPASTLTSAKVGEYVDHLMAARLSGSTINRHLAPVSVLAEWACRLNLMTTRPLIPWQKEGEGRLRWFTTQDEELILSTCRTWGEHAYYDLFMFLVDTGARVGEALKLDWACFSAGLKAVTFWETKAGNHRTIPLTTRVQQMLTRRRNQSAPFADVNRWTMRSFWLRLRTAYPQFDDTVIHTFRHTCASRLVQRGIDLYRVKEWMGHKAIQTTMRYAHLCPSGMQALADVLEE